MSDQKGNYKFLYFYFTAWNFLNYFGLLKTSLIFVGIENFKEFLETDRRNLIEQMFLIFITFIF